VKAFAADLKPKYPEDTIKVMGTLEMDETDAKPSPRAERGPTGVKWRFHHQLSDHSAVISEDPHDPRAVIELSRIYMDPFCATLSSGRLEGFQEHLQATLQFLRVGWCRYCDTL
jgi:hypothetical protein